MFRVLNRKKELKMSKELIDQLTEIQEIGFGLIQEPDDYYAQQVFVGVKADDFVEGAPEEIKETIKKVLVELLSEQVVLPDEFYTDSYARLVKDLQEKLQRQAEYMFVDTHVDLVAKQLVQSYDELEPYPDITLRDLELDSTYFYRYSWGDDGLIFERTTHFVLAEELIRQVETDGQPPAIVEAPYVEKEEVEWAQQDDADWGEQKEREWEDNFDEWLE